jgi:AcrR family transcriptional regulator
MARIVASTRSEPQARQRVPATERRDALIAAAVQEFGRTGLHGTPVARIAQIVGVAQPYVFSLFASKLELFLAAIDRGFDQIGELFTRTANEWAEGDEAASVLEAMGAAYRELLESDRSALLLQLQAYAACDDPPVRERVRHRYAGLVQLVRDVSQAPPEDVDLFFIHGMALNVAAAMGVAELSVDCEWVRAAAAAEVTAP